MKKFKKSVALLLAMLMIFSVAPISALAEEVTSEGEVTENPEAAWFSSYGVRRGEGTLVEAFESVPLGGSVKLLRNVDDFSEVVTLNKSAVFDGQGYTVKRGDEYGGVMFSIDNGNALTVTNVTIDGGEDVYPGSSDSVFEVVYGDLILNTGAVITNNYSASENGLGGAIRANAPSGKLATVIMNTGASITDCRGYIGGAVYLGDNSSFTMNDGLIKTCKASESGGGVAVASVSAKFSMVGGKITDCSAGLISLDFGGAAVYAGAGTTAISAGSITENTLMSALGAVYIENNAIASIGGTAYVWNNYGSGADQSNVYIPHGSVLNVYPEFKEGCRIGVTTPEHYKEADNIENLDFINSEYDIMGFIFGDYDGTTFYNSEGVWSLILCITVTFDPGNGECEYYSKVYPVDVDFGSLPEVTPRDGFEFLGWYTATDDLVTDQTSVYMYEDFTLYAKWENLNQLDNSTMGVFGRFFQSIGDILQMIFDFLENLFTGGGNDDIEDLEQIK